MKKLVMPSQKKIYNLGGGWFSKESLAGVRGLYHQTVLEAGAKLGDPAFRAAYNHTKGIVSGGATVYSDHWTITRAGRRQNPNAAGGRMRALYWEFASLPAGTTADVLVCGKMFKDERFVGGFERHSALDSTEGAATGEVGTYAVASDGITLGDVIDANEFLAAADWDAAGGAELAATVALSFGLVCTADQFLCITNSVGKFVAAGAIKGVAYLLGT